jgi:uncharacterized membrane protein
MGVRLGPSTGLRTPVYSLLLPVAITCFLGALATDLSYLGSGGNLLWLNFSCWLLAGGLVFAGFAGVALIVAILRREGGSWLQLALLAAAWIVEFLNSLIHARDGWTAVAGAGLILSIIGAVLILVAGWLWQSTRYVVEGDRA